MIAFADLLERLLFTSSRAGKIALLRRYFTSHPDPERGFGLAVLTGGLKFAAAKPGLLRELAAERTDPVLFAMSLEYVGDLAETLALMWPGKPSNHTSPLLSEVVETLGNAPKSEVAGIAAGWLDASDAAVRLVLLKLVTGGLRPGVSARLVKTALAACGDGISPDEIEEIWQGLKPPYTALFAWIFHGRPKPDPLDAPVFHAPMLARSIEAADLVHLDPSAYRAEWKWDGVGVQMASTTGGRALYSREAEDLSAGFPEVLAAMDSHAVLEGALLVMRDGVVAPFSDLQQRLNRKTVSPKLLRDQPAHVRLTDMLFDGTEDLRPLPYDQRRARLEAWFARTQPPRMDLSPPIAFRTWDELAELRQSARAVSIDGLMLKRADSPYVPGDSQGRWLKWQCPPLTIDAVLMYAQRGPDSQSEYTFGLWRGEELLPVGKTSLGLSDTDQALLDAWIRAHTTNRFGPVREVERGIVLEVAFDTAQRSTRHKSGVALRSPRIKRLCTDKPSAGADQLETLMALIA